MAGKSRNCGMDAGFKADTIVESWVIDADTIPSEQRRRGTRLGVRFRKSRRWMTGKPRR
jgi:hypothetical protein